MTTAMMTPILGAIDRAGYAYINILGGAVFDVCVRYLHENPWERIGLLCEHLATPCDALTRAQSLYTFELFPDDIVALNSHAFARRGIEVLTVYDALNDNRNIESSVRSGHEAGMKVNAMMTYTLSPGAHRCVLRRAHARAGDARGRLHFDQGSDRPADARARAHAVPGGRAGGGQHSAAAAFALPVRRSRPRSTKSRCKAASGTATPQPSRWPTARRCRRPRTSCARAPARLRHVDER